MVLDYTLPDARQAVAVMRARLGSLGTKADLTKLGEYTNGLSHADLVKAAESAAKAVLMRGEAQVEREDIIVSLKARRSATLG
ncbi:AAA-family ATPase domain protein [Mycobacteroides abscessus subsp. bolletii 1513]|uniref:AAA-family ATPase domain protein n=2 Tax=Mycobacteroides abscessus TaxID=36809 RepID=X8DTK7_9MYCO|nr:AAA-family ATPase domain protein [Mycobacteroides abscessus subsp. bolletii 1513]